MASSGKPLGHSSCAPGPKTLLLSGMREEHVTTLATGVNVHLSEHFSAGLHDHSYNGGGPCNDEQRARKERNIISDKPQPLMGRLFL